MKNHTLWGRTYLYSPYKGVPPSGKNRQATQAHTAVKRGARAQFPPKLSLKKQSRPQSPRYPCPAERENEDLWEDAFELGISLVINGACAVQPEVDKQLFCSQISNSKLAARDGFASSGYDRFEHETKQSASTHKSTTRS